MSDIDWKFWITFLTNIIGLGIMWYQTYIGKQQISTLPSPRSAKRVSAERQLYRRMYTAVAIMAGLVLVSWAPYVFQKSSPPVLPAMIGAWGGDATGCTAQIDTSSLVEAANKYHIFDICHVMDGTVDELADTRLAVSKPFTITGGVVTILVKFAPTSAIAQSLKDAASSGTTTAQLGHSIVLLPKEEDGSNVKTLGDVPKLGGFILIPGRPKPKF